MNTRSRISILAGTSAIALLIGVPDAARAADAAAAQGLARQNNCLKCHTVDKAKGGPAFKDVAAKYKDKADAVAKLTTHVTTGPKVKLEGGFETTHPAVKAKSADEVKNLVEWILSL